MQQTATTGLVLRQVKVGEADQILTLLTPDLGVVSASARGSLRPKNKLFSACGLFCYSEFVITAGRSSHFIDSAQIKRSFHGLSQSVEGMALAMYLAEVAAALSPAPPESAEHLRLLLNSLYMLSEGKRPLPQLKAIYELRAMTLCLLRQIRRRRFLLGPRRGHAALRRLCPAPQPDAQSGRRGAVRAAAYLPGGGQKTVCLYADAPKPETAGFRQRAVSAGPPGPGAEKPGFLKNTGGAVSAPARPLRLPFAME